MALSSLQTKFLNANMKIQSLFCGIYWKQSITRTVFDVYIHTCFYIQQEVCLFVGYLIVVCYGRGRSASEENIRSKKRGCVKNENKFTFPADWTA
jgi:hypothetical protein